jgi:hypothetical protein
VRVAVLRLVGMKAAGPANDGKQVSQQCSGAASKGATEGLAPLESAEPASVRVCRGGHNGNVGRPHLPPLRGPHEYPKSTIGHMRKRRSAAMARCGSCLDWAHRLSILNALRADRVVAFPATCKSWTLLAYRQLKLIWTFCFLWHLRILISCRLYYNGRILRC